MRLRKTSTAQPGWTRRRAGKGFSYRDQNGQPLARVQVDRIKSLAIPPAWVDVWISPYENGHLQAAGVDVAGRRQYLYHSQWRVLQDRAKFDRILAMGKTLPKVRTRLSAALELDDLSREQVLAATVRLLDLGYFRIGNDVYEDDNGSYGLTTLRRRHVTKRGEAFEFRFLGKSGVEHEVEVIDEPISWLLRQLLKRRSADEHLLAWKENRRWRSVTSGDVNAYLKELFALEEEVTAKDFRTWHGTVLAADVLSEFEGCRSRAERQRAIRSAMEEVAEYLGNTPAIAKSAYVDPRVLDRFEDNVTIGPPSPRATRDPDLLQHDREQNSSEC